jgi:hypothetical protein
MNTLRPAEETWIDKEKDRKTSTYEDGTSLEWLITYCCC